MITITKEQLIEDLKASEQNASGMFEISEDTICALMSMLDAATAPVSVPYERAAFETFMEKRFKDCIDRRLVKNGDGEYFAWDMQVAWIVWQGRAAMLHGKAEPRDSVRRDHAEWSQSTFGNVGPVGPLKHLSKEALEAAAEPDDLSEWADMQFLLWDAQRRACITDDQITKAMIEKLAVNKTRLWPEPKDGEPRLHIKAAPKHKVTK